MMRGEGGGCGSRTHLRLDSRVIFVMRLPAVGVAGGGRASVVLRGGGAFWELAVWRVPESPRGSCGALGTMLLEAHRPWWCSAPSALRKVDPPPLALPGLEVDPPPWAHRHSVGGRPPWARRECWAKCQAPLACHRCRCCRQPASVFGAVEASSVVPSSSSGSWQ